MARILVIDDEPGIRDVLSILLKDEGHEVRVAEDGSVGLRLAADFAPDLAITDLVMPGQEGIETIARLRKDHKDIKIVAISGYASRGHDYLRTAKVLGASATVAKPIDYDTFLPLVRDILARR